MISRILKGAFITVLSLLSKSIPFKSLLMSLYGVDLQMTDSSDSKPF